MSDFKFRGIASSIESDHSSILHGHMSERELEQVEFFSSCLLGTLYTFSFLFFCVRLSSFFFLPFFFYVLSSFSLSLGTFYYYYFYVLWSMFDVLLPCSASFTLRLVLVL